MTSQVDDPYQQMTMEYLKNQNPKELHRLRKEGKLAEFLRDVQEIHNETEKVIFDQMTEDIPADAKDRRQKINQAGMEARHESRRQLGTFLRSL